MCMHYVIVKDTSLRLLSNGDNPLNANGLNVCGHQFLRAFRNTGDKDDIDRAIAAYKQAAACLSPDDPRLGEFLHDIGIGCLKRYMRFGGLDDLQTAIDTMKKGIMAATVVEHSNLPNQLNDLGSSFFFRFVRTGVLEDLSEAIQNQESAVQMAPDGDVDLPTWLNNLGTSFSRRFQCTGDLNDISKAIENQQRSVQLTPDGHTDLPSMLTNLGNSFSRCFQCTGDLDDISKAIKNQRQAVQLTPNGHARLPAWLNNLGISLSLRFACTGALGDLSEAIKNQEYAVQLTSDGHPELPARLNNVGKSLSCRFERMGDLDDIYRAIKNQQRAVGLTPYGHIDLPSRLTNLGVSFSRRFERTGNLDDICEAIKNLQQAVKLTPDRHAHDLAANLSDLGISFLFRFKHTGDLDDISEAINNQQHSVQLTPGGHADLPAKLNNLGISFLCRFEHSRNLDDLSEAIKNQQHSVRLTPDEHAKLPVWLNNLGTSILCRFERRGDPDDISEAIKIQQHSVKLTQDGHTDMPASVNNLGNSFLRRFEHSRDPDDISKAIKNYEHAVKLTLDGHADLPSRLTNLGNSFLRRFESSRDLDDISRAIKNHQQAVQLTPDGHADLPAWRNNLGISFSRLFEHSGNPEFLAKAVSSYRLSATSVTGPPRLRLLAAKRWAMLLQNSSSPELLDAHASIIQLLSIVSGLEDTIQRRHETLANSSQLSTAASATALSLGHPDKALEWLVEGRCVVWNQIQQLRTPVDELRAHDQKLADEFSVVSRGLENLGSRSEPHNEMSLPMDYKISLEKQAGKHIKLVKKWDQLLVKIRDIPGFEDFLRPKKSADIMCGLPNDGVIVVINIHNDRCDALALMAGACEPMHIPLQNFSYQEAERLAKGFYGYLLHHGVISRIGTPLDPNDRPLLNVDLTEVLSVLWSQVVWPILESLAFSVPDTKSSAKLPRIWWCPTGPISFLPIHAAGIYVRRSDSEGMPNQCLSDFAVSSYIPTLNPLFKTSLNSVQKRGDASTGLLIVSQPNTPNKSQIPYAAVEAQRISKQFENKQIPSITLADKSGTVEGVLKAMELFSSIHLACHASQNTTSPLKSSIYLHDDPLELSKIVKRDLPNSDFAFLSACQTSTGDRNLPEEVVHLAAGMLVAGYRSVVGTMWSISDKHGPDIAEFFYEGFLSTTEGSKIDGARAAQALHRATQRFRETIPDMPDSLLVWVPYIHIGV